MRKKKKKKRFSKDKKERNHQRTRKYHEGEAWESVAALFKVGGWKGGRRVRERADSFGGKKRKVLHPSQADLNQKKARKKKEKNH